jgi:hypothetical protein
MSVRYKAAAAILGIVLGLCPLAAQTDATADDTPQQAGTPRTNDDLLRAGEQVDVTRAVDGDVVVAGAEVTIAAPVSGYVVSAGRSVTVQQRVGNDIWAAGETVSLDSTIGNNAMLAGRTVRLGRNTRIGDDARLAGNTVTADGRVDGNLDIGADRARIGAEVGGTVTARADKVSVLPGAMIRGDLVVRANQPPEISPQAEILGEVRYEQAEAFQWSWAGRWLYAFLALLVLGMTIVAIAPDWSARVGAAMRARTVASVLYGLLVLVVLPVAVAGLTATLIGIPLAVVGLAFYIAILALSGVFVAYRLGDWLMTRLHLAHGSIWARMILGVLLVSLGVSLPIIGLGIAIIVVVLGAGAFVLAGRSQLTGVPATA